MAAAGPRQHLQFINPVQQGAGTFTCFNKLPPELRLMIWEQSLFHERLVEVDLWPGKSSKHLEEFSQLERPFSTIARCRFNSRLRRKRYLIVLKTRHEVSGLFSVCSESRQAALSFYRVQVPCYYKQRGGRPKKGTMYFHPELDTLHIVGFLRYFANFAHKLWRRDPRRVGLVHIALTSDYRPDQNHGLLFKPFKNDKSHTQLGPALARLRRVIFGYTGRIGRGFPHIRSLTWDDNELPGYETSLKRQNQMRRSRPLLASTSEFQRLPVDPRQIEEELKGVYIGKGDPRVQMRCWFDLLEKWNIKYQHSVDYRFMITFTNKEHRKVSNRDEAYLSLQEEEEKWKVCQRVCIKRGVPCGDDQQALPSAFGFWLFPIDAFGPVQSVVPQDIQDGTVANVHHDQNDDHLEREWNLSGCKHELCLQCLPNAPRHELDVSNSLEDKDESRQQLSLQASFGPSEFHPFEPNMLTALREMDGN